MIQHLIRLIQHEGVNITQCHEPSLHHLDQASGCGNQDLEGALKTPLCLFHGGAAQERPHAETRRMSEWFEGLGDLLTQLPGGNHDDGPGLAINFYRLSLEFEGLEPMQNRKRVGKGFSTSRLGNSNDGTPGKQCRHCLCLDLGGSGQAPFDEGLLKGGKQGEIGKGVHKKKPG